MFTTSGQASLGNSVETTKIRLKKKSHTSISTIVSSATSMLFGAWSRTAPYKRIELAVPLWTDPGLKTGISMHKLISTLKKEKKKKKAQAGNELSNILPENELSHILPENELSNILPKSSQARKLPSPQVDTDTDIHLLNAVQQLTLVRRTLPRGAYRPTLPQVYATVLPNRSSSQPPSFR